MFRLIIITLVAATCVSLLDATAISSSAIASIVSSTSDPAGVSVKSENQVHVPGQRNIVVSALSGTAGLARNVTSEAGSMVSSLISGVTNFGKHSFRAVAESLSRSVNRIRGKHLWNQPTSSDPVHINVQPGDHVDVNLNELNNVESSGAEPDELVNSAATAEAAASS